MLHVSSGEHRWAHLYEGWEHTEVAVGDTANVIVAHDQWTPAADGELHCLINAGGGGLFVLHPDMLISGTSIATALRCPRQAMLQERGVGSPSRSACLGTLMHELTQAALLALSQGKLAAQATGAGMQRPAPFPRRANPTHEGLLLFVNPGLHCNLCWYAWCRPSRWHGKHGVAFYD